MKAPRRIAVVLAVLGVTAAGGVYTAVADSSSAISACVHQGNGELYTDRACARHDRSLTWDVMGPQGVTGPQGPPGQQGPPGPKGDPGTIAAAQDGGQEPPALGGDIGDSRTFTDTVIETGTTGSVFAYGHLDLSVDCPSVVPTSDCGYSVGLYLDGQPIPGSVRSVDLPAFSSSDQVAELFGVASNVPAGTHHVAIGYRTLLHGPSITNVGGETHSAAIAAGT
jgi:hypothetical protein